MNTSYIDMLYDIKAQNAASLFFLIIGVCIMSLLVVFGVTYRSEKSSGPPQKKYHKKNKRNANKQALQNSKNAFYRKKILLILAIWLLVPIGGGYIGYKNHQIEKDIHNESFVVYDGSFETGAHSQEACGIFLTDAGKRTRVYAYKSQWYATYTEPIFDAYSLYEGRIIYGASSKIVVHIDIDNS